MKRSKGAVALATKLAPKPQVNQTELARQLDVTPQAVSAWLSGKALPAPALMAKIEDIMGVPMRAWTELAEDGAA